MNVPPLRRCRFPAVALLQPGYRMLTMITENGTETARGPRRCRALLEQHAKHKLYVDTGLTGLRHTTGAAQWTAKTWRGRVVSMALEGTSVTVTSLRGVLAEATDPFSELEVALNWLASFGVGPASPSTMAWNLWRATLERDVSIAFEAGRGRSALFGGRQEIREPRTYKHMAAVDLKAAYPFSMAAAPYALALEEVDNSTNIDPNVAGLAECTVTVPTDLAYAPLPVRISRDAIQWQWGVIRGTWPWCEVAAALELGCHVRVHRSWAPSRTADLFGAWWPMVEAGRELGGVAGRFLKMISNALWGMFGMVGDDREIVAWSDDANVPFVVRHDNRRLPHANMAHIAAETTARVRVRLLREALYADGGQPVHVDTDGVIVRRSRPLPARSGAGAGEWRTKQKMLRVDVRAPQLYRWDCVLCGVDHLEGHYVAAGATADQARSLFGTVPRSRLQISWRPTIDVVLPPAHSSEGGMARAVAG